MYINNRNNMFQIQISFVIETNRYCVQLIQSSKLYSNVIFRKSTIYDSYVV